jgi:hypothetical protein
MRIAILTILLTAITASIPQANPNLNYSLFTTLDNPKDLTSLTIAPDYSRALLY